MTTNILILVLSSVLSYLIGAIPFAYIIARHYGVDVRKTGSGNVGATNVLRSVGKTAGITTLFLDATKGFLPAFLIPLAVESRMINMPGHTLQIVCAFSAICGHVWPVYLKFRGGKGIATSAGALIAMAPSVVLAGMMVWVTVFAASRYVSLASIIAAAVIPIAGWYVYRPEGLLLPLTLILIGSLAVIKHKSNIQRLIKGTESRISFSKKNSSTTGAVS